MPFSIWLLVLVGALGIPAVTCAALYRGALVVGRSGPDARRIAVLAGVAWAAWTALIWALAAAGLFHLPPTQPQPWIPVAVVLGVVIVVAASRRPAARAILADPGALRLLAWPQVLRVVGVVFLIAMAMGRIPAAFALPAGIGDIVTGLAAPFAIRSGRVLWLNIVGLLDLVVALALGLLTGVGQGQILAVSPSSELVSTLPLVLIPLAAVPLAIGLHLVSMTRMGALARESRRRHVVAA
ncbi:hypothetical protein [Labedaea rhizosphaerae]|uniref:Uncharacterized protein n=1 Tax=Labedaea rhizosphaerae TaxID=598644 RepID=A0A4R6S9B9_LABRH|nr:hypothetical protein [Labedaea rhizosphaerae]TDP96034.1 hypothetical protein EV186_10414 [Labedaea rhizosphaerae]